MIDVRSRRAVAAATTESAVERDGDACGARRGFRGWNDSDAEAYRAICAGDRETPARSTAQRCAQKGYEIIRKKKKTDRTRSLLRRIARSPALSRTLTSRETGLAGTPFRTNSARASPPNLTEPRESLTPVGASAAVTPDLLPPFTILVREGDTGIEADAFEARGVVAPAASANDMTRRELVRLLMRACAYVSRMRAESKELLPS